MLLATISVAGLVSAKNAEERKETKTVEKEVAVKAQCQSVGIFIPCTNENLSDTICWGEGTGNATYDDAVVEESHNAHLLVEFLCG